jgi:hypothetical protein
MVDLPAREVRPADVPALALAVRFENEGALSRANQYPYLAHPSLLSKLSCPVVERASLISTPTVRKKAKTSSNVEHR